MWETRCQQCGWTSGERVLMEAADVLGEIHEMDHPGHRVERTEIKGVGSSNPAP